jgi:hypothetical protein
MHTIVCDVSTGEISHVNLTPEKIAEIEAYVPRTAPLAPTKEELLAQLNVLSAQIQALE